MKKRIICGFTICIAMVLLLLICYPFLSDKLHRLFEDEALRSLPLYEDAERHYSEGVQDYTNYCKYYYSQNENIVDALEENEYYNKVSEGDVEYIKSYFAKFEDRVRYADYKDKYDFDIDIIDNADYYCMQNKSNCEKYKNYHNEYAAFDIYFFDAQTQILYFIHSNI